MKLIKTMLVLGGAGLIGGMLFVYLGVFNVAADDPHTKPVYWLMEAVRERSVALRARGIDVPPLDDPAMITSGAADYNEMCSGCHLRPGVERSEMASAMYPPPPNLVKVKRDNPAATFWIIKHGFKMSGMPAWGLTHDDHRLWAMVAFLQQLPRLTPAQYQILTARSADDSSAHAHGDMQGMAMPEMAGKSEAKHGAAEHDTQGQGEEP